MFATILSLLGSLSTGLLNSTQLQSFGRTALKVGGALLISKYGIDPNNVASVVGAVSAAAGILSSIKAHAPTATVSTTEIIGATVQAVLAGYQSPAQPTPIAAS